MAKFNKTLWLLPLSLLLITPPSFAGTDAYIGINANIISGTCNIALGQNQVYFGLFRATDFNPSSSVAIQPLNVTVNCDENTMPYISVSGTTPYSGIGTIFSDSSTSGTGFMVRQDTGGITANNFYNTTHAIPDNTKFLFTQSLINKNTSHTEKLLIGFVRAGATPVNVGIVSTQLTFNVFFD